MLITNVKYGGFWSISSRHYHECLHDACSPFMETASSYSEITDIVVIGHFLIIVVRGPDLSWAFVRSLSIYSSVRFVGNPTADKETQCGL